MIGLIISEVVPWFAVAGFCGAALAVIRSAQVRSSLDMITEANVELRQVVLDEKREREDDRRRCETQLAEMRGQIATLTGEFGRQVAAAIVDEWHKMGQPVETTQRTTVQRTTTTKGSTL